MDYKNIGYVICETDITSQRVTNLVSNEPNRSGRRKLIAEAILQTADERNRNGRFYPHEELIPGIKAPRLQELISVGYLRSESGHPLSKDLVRQQTIVDSNTNAVFLKVWNIGNNIWAQFTPTNNALGESLGLDLLDGYKPAWSLRALGSLCNTRRGAEVRNLKIITWDQVIYPSHPGAYTQRIVSESCDLGIANMSEQTFIDEQSKSLVIPITNQSVLNYIKSESANIKYVKEQFDFMYDNITVNENNSMVTLTDKSGNIFYINLEQHIHNEIMNYCSEISDYFK